MKSHITTITILALTLGACFDEGDDTSSSSSPATSITSDSDESSDGESSSSGDVDESSSDEGEASSSSTGDDVPACEPVPLPDGTTCCCDPDHPAPDCPADTPACGGASQHCEGVAPALEHDACGSTCEGQCAAAYTCRGNYAGGYLAECSRLCTIDTDCDVAGDVCSAGWCVTPCGPAGECAEGLTCYPPEGVTNDEHPLPHCMPMREGT